MDPRMHPADPPAAAVVQLRAQPITLQGAPALLELYRAAPDYFDLLGTQIPSLGEVESDIGLALLDRRRHVELLCLGEEVTGLIDWKTDYPEPGDVTINLLLIRREYRSRGLGHQAVRNLEARLPQGTQRVLASVLGINPGARGCGRAWATALP
ncbi:GNAT family N-acetyltransferase [Deinococcus lacus]|uniref:GNAT family N-acetyltransferase n=1 Tax=Deinococcus lacus TaxID=392561 RepID=A0ABW1YFC0_9DEIO